MRINIFLVAISLIAVHAHAQNNNEIKLLAKSKDDGIWLRWAPTNPQVWQLGNKHGYLVERFTLTSNGDIENPLGDKLTTLRVFSPTDLDKLAVTVKEASVIKELVYGKISTTPFKADNPASIIAKNKELQNGFGISLLMCDLSTKVAESAALFFKDESAKKGKKYIYRITLANYTQETKIEPGVSIVDVKDEVPLAPPNNFKIQFEDKKVTLSWSTLMDRGIYSAYHIEKSEDGKTFNRLTKLPYIHMSQRLESETAYFVDSLTQNNKPFFYRVMGVTPFAETGPASKVLEGQGKDDLSGFLVLKEAKVADNSTVTLKWEFPVSFEKQIAGFTISKTSDPTKPFVDVNKVMLPTDKREFVDKPNANNTYYVVRGIDTKGEERLKSFPFLVQLEDKTPPLVPTGLTGAISKNGIATLRWTPNQDADLKGYRVFKSNKPSDEFIEVTRVIITEPFFNDSVNIKVLNKKVYYRIVAVDKNYNPSEYSPYITLVKPDVVSPAPPVFQLVEVRGAEIYLSWVSSISDDVAKYELYRNSKADTAKQKISEWSVRDNKINFSDKSLALGNTYRYFLTAKDSADNKSTVKSGDIYFETGVRPAVTSLKSKVDREAKTILLTWVNPSQAEKVIIYRKENDGQLTIYQTIDGNIESFLEKGRSVSINNTYSYKVQPIFKGGIRGILSVELKVKF